jgi:putative sterol carrier protein
MASTNAFLEALQARQEEPLLRHVSGTIRFDLRRGETIEPWLVTVDDGTVSVRRRAGRADCTARMDADLFEAIARGEANAYAAALRGEIEIEGQPALLLTFQRLFPGALGSDRSRAETLGSPR